MNIRRVYSRKTKDNHYRRFFAEHGNTMWWIHTNHEKTTSIRRRITVSDDQMTEKEISGNELPDLIKAYLYKNGIEQI